MPNEPYYTIIKPTLRFKTTMLAISLLRAESLTKRFLNDIKRHPERYIRYQQKKPPDKE